LAAEDVLGGARHSSGSRVYMEGVERVLAKERSEGDVSEISVEQA